MAIDIGLVKATIKSLGGSYDDLPANDATALAQRLIEVCAAFNGGSGSSGGGLPTGGSPNQMLVTDSTGAAGWEDKLCWVTGKEVIVLPETVMTLADGYYVGTVPTESDITLGEVYTITYNGVAYQCEAQAVEGYAFGNLGAMVEGFDVTSDPFILLVYPPEMAESLGGVSSMLFPLDGATDITISVQGAVKTVKTIDEQYMPGYVFGYIPYTGRVFMREKTFSTASGSAMIPVYNSPLLNGQVYTVTYNGTEYTVTARMNDNGNAIIIGKFDGEGDEPFAMTYVPDGLTGEDGNTYQGMLLVYDSAESCTVSIIGSGEETIKVPASLLEDTATPLIVRVDRSSYQSTTISSVSHTYDEIKQAYKAGRTIFCWLVTGDSNTHDFLLPLIKYSSYGACFIFQSSLWGEHENYRLTISSSANTLEEMTGPTFNTVEITRTGSGLVMTSPSGTRYQLAVADDGTLTTTAL